MDNAEWSLEDTFTKYYKKAIPNQKITLGNSCKDATNFNYNCHLIVMGTESYGFHEWPRQNFSSQYQYNIKQTSDENKEKYQLGD